MATAARGWSDAGAAVAAAWLQLPLLHQGAPSARTPAASASGRTSAGCQMLDNHVVNRGDTLPATNTSV